MIGNIARGNIFRNAMRSTRSAALVNPMRNSLQFRNASGFGSSEQAQLLEKLSKAPKALDIIKELSQVMQEKGVEPGSNPSVQTMYSLATDTRVKELSTELNKELKEAGIDAKEMVKELMPGSESGEESDK